PTRLGDSSSRHQSKRLTRIVNLLFFLRLFNLESKRRNRKLSSGQFSRRGSAIPVQGTRVRD
ncbi:MAG: hypothetical protein ACLT5B_07730, partial [Clostridia bacterium]